MIENGNRTLVSTKTAATVDRDQYGRSASSMIAPRGYVYLGTPRTGVGLCSVVSRGPVEEELYANRA